MNGKMLEPVESWNEHKIRALFPHSADVQIISYRFENDISSAEVILLYSEGLCETSQIGEVVLPELEHLFRQNGFKELLLDRTYGSLPLIPLEANATSEQISELIFEGDLLLLFPPTNALYKMCICNRPQRTPWESSTEVSIKGPKDGFVEDISVNVALIRKRLRSPSLYYETYTLGKRTKTKVGLLYFQDIIAPEILERIQKKISQLQIDGLFSINQLEETITDNKYSLMPLLDYTGRPDKAVSSLLAGRFVIIVDGNPMVLIGPATFLLMLKSPEDLYFSFQYISFARFIRIFSFCLSILLPGAWVALSSFHPDQIPFRLMATISSARIGLPFSGQLELFILLLLLEIFREAGLRLPNSLGQTLTVVGGLIIGDAAIRAGLVSPSVVVVGAITAVSGTTLVSQSLSASVSVIRLVLFFISSFLGMFGLLLGIVLLIGYMSTLRSLGVPYLSPISPLIIKDLWGAIFRIPWGKNKSRPRSLHTIDSDRQGED
ncbi:spore germination protein [Paenibacillus radicis (ex Xue et al. 2023)]|uniref:Spore germination protein n=1 Tax=Paenibacillus radicis (ex Xue et al. 2023) TaxID=2972489 RepID=A0ABT1YLF6_9BACL|nr:spore germination protein [Paenibacillus radicis (ex Xue et al. 2023)]MCR8634013.1 spore germination protein [Paenibacillus radicis (ex Xue et al. 2023)]